MKNKHPNAIVVLVLGFAMAGLHLADLLLWSDEEGVGGGREAEELAAEEADE